MRLLVGTWRSKAFRLAVLSALLVGTWLRLRGYILDPPTLWLDEAAWAMRVLERPISRCSYRPVGFVVVTKWLVQALGATEPAWRALPFVASVGALWLMPFVASRLLRNQWLVVLTVILFAIHPVAIEMSVEFKQYGVEIGVFVVLLAAYLLHREKQKTWSLTLLVVTAWLLFLFSLTVIFLFPALFTVLGLEALFRRNWRRLVIVVSGTLATLATVVAVYLLVWTSVSQPRQEKHWGHFYDVFYLKSEPRNRETSQLGWTVAKYVTLAANAGDGRVKTLGDSRAKWETNVLDDETVEDLSDAVGWVWFGLHLAGLWCLVRRKKYDWLLLLWTPLHWVIVFNLLGRWPAGSFRVNVFYTPYSLLVAMLGLDWMVAWGSTRRRWPLPTGLRLPVRAIGPLVAAFITLPALWLRPGWQPKGALWTETGRFREALQELAARRPPVSVRKTILLDNSSWRPWVYYLRYDALLPEQTRRAVREGFRPTHAWGGRKFWDRLDRLVRTRKGQDFYVMLSKTYFHDKVRDKLRTQCKRVEFTQIHNHTILRCVAPKG